MDVVPDLLEVMTEKLLGRLKWMSFGNVDIRWRDEPFEYHLRRRKSSGQICDEGSSVKGLSAGISINRLRPPHIGYNKPMT